MHTLTVAEIPSHAHSGKTDKHSFSLWKTRLIGATHGLGAAGQYERQHFNHQHSFTTAPQGGEAAHENRPPYYVLAYIMYAGG